MGLDLAGRGLIERPPEVFFGHFRSGISALRKIREVVGFAQNHPKSSWGRVTEAATRQIQPADRRRGMG